MEDVEGYLKEKLDRFERAFLPPPAAGPHYPPIFVLGAPRSGTTALFLSIVNSYRVSYFPNISNRHPFAPLTSALAGSMASTYRATFRYRFGIVDQPLGPSDGWKLFHRWFRDEYQPTVSADRLHELRRLICGFERIYRGPFCVRHNFNSLRVPHLVRAFPGAVFPAIWRDFREAAVSLADAYRAHNIRPDRWWSAGPPGCDFGSFEGRLEKAAYAVLGVEAIMRRDLRELDADRYRLVQYRDFCREPHAVRKWLEARFRRSGVRLRRRPGYGQVTSSIERSTRLTEKVESARGELDRYFRHFLEGKHLVSDDVLTDEVRGAVQPHIERR